MAQHQGQRLREVAVDHVEVAGAHPAGRDPNESLALLGRRQLDVEDLDGTPGLSQNGCLHPHGGERTAPPP
jgi:hypothetical protein